MYDYFYRIINNKIVINTAKRRLFLYTSGKLVKSYMVGVGKPKTPTPKGNYIIINKAVNPGGPFGARWLGLNKKGIGIHGTNNPPSIGRYVSNGCIRMYNSDVIELFDIVSIGTPVKIV